MVSQSNGSSDVIVIGAGIAGATSALLLARQGLRVSVVDPFPVYPTDFRCEKLTTHQIVRLKRLGLYELLRPVSAVVSEVVVARGGRVIEAKAIDEICLRYETRVNTVRQAWPEGVTFVEGRVEDIVADAERPSIVLGDGRHLDARLVILATGPGERLRAQLGLDKRVVRNNHSICIGFDLVAAAGGPIAPRSLTYYGERAGDGMAYVTIFPFGDRTRCNVFCYLDPKSDMIREMRSDPLSGLKRAMPGIGKLLGPDVRVDGRSEMRVTHLHVLDEPQRDGVVLIGEAFRPSCPVTGTGVTRIMSDVERLARVHIPRWFETPGMGREKIVAFYADPDKLAVDAASASNAERQRAFAILRSPYVRARRFAAVAKAYAGFLSSRKPLSERVFRTWDCEASASGRDAQMAGAGNRRTNAARELAA